MQNGISNHKISYYRVVKSREVADGKIKWMYGIEGFSNGESVSLRALSFARKRIETLVDGMNAGVMELETLRMVIDCFLLSS